MFRFLQCKQKVHTHAHYNNVLKLKLLTSTGLTGPSSENAQLYKTFSNPSIIISNCSTFFRVWI